MFWPLFWIAVWLIYRAKRSGRSGLVAASFSRRRQLLRAKRSGRSGLVAGSFSRRRQLLENPPSPAPDSAEIDDLRARVRVLERITVDANTAEVRRRDELADEIESLRDR